MARGRASHIGSARLSCAQRRGGAAV